MVQRWWLSANLQRLLWPASQQVVPHRERCALLLLAIIDPRALMTYLESRGFANIEEVRFERHQKKGPLYRVGHWAYIQDIFVALAHPPVHNGVRLATEPGLIRSATKSLR